MTQLPALILIDYQQAIDDPSWAREGCRTHKNAELAALRLLDAWRAAGGPIYHVRHDSVEPRSTYRPGQPGHDFKPGFEPRAGEEVIAKQTGSAFTGTAFEQLLRSRGHLDLMIAGVITNNSIEATVRHAGTLAFCVTLAEDACFTFGRRDWNGVLRTAEEVHAMSLANLDGEYCRVSTSADVLAAVGSPQPILPYFDRPVSISEWDERAPAVAEQLRELIEHVSPGSRVEHIGSTAVPGCAGKGIIDLLVSYAEGGLESVKRGLASLGFQPQAGRDPFPEDRPMRIGACASFGSGWRVHAHVIAADAAECGVLRGFRDRLRASRALMNAYVAEKRAIVAHGVRDGLEYSNAKDAFIAGH